MQLLAALNDPCTHLHGSQSGIWQVISRLENVMLNFHFIVEHY